MYSVTLLKKVQCHGRYTEYEYIRIGYARKSVQHTTKETISPKPENKRWMNENMQDQQGYDRFHKVIVNKCIGAKLFGPFWISWRQRQNLGKDSHSMYHQTQP